EAGVYLLLTDRRDPVAQPPGQDRLPDLGAVFPQGRHRPVPRHDNALPTVHLVLLTGTSSLRVLVRSTGPDAEGVRRLPGLAGGAEAVQGVGGRHADAQVVVVEGPGQGRGRRAGLGAD